jgi:hypothetical protein
MFLLADVEYLHRTLVRVVMTVTPVKMLATMWDVSMLILSNMYELYPTHGPLDTSGPSYRDEGSRASWIPPHIRRCICAVLDYNTVSCHKWVSKEAFDSVFWVAFETLIPTCLTIRHRMPEDMYSCHSSVIFRDFTEGGREAHWYWVWSSRTVVWL